MESFSLAMGGFGRGAITVWGGRFSVMGRITEQPVLKQVGTQTNWTAIAVGQSHNLALKTDGTIWAWGENMHGPLGDGTRMRFQATPVASVNGNDWMQLAAGVGHSAALKRDGNLWAWGSNGRGNSA